MGKEKGKENSKLEADLGWQVVMRVEKSSHAIHAQHTSYCGGLGGRTRSETAPKIERLYAVWNGQPLE